MESEKKKRFWPERLCWILLSGLLILHLLFSPGGPLFMFARGGVDTYRTFEEGGISSGRGGGCSFRWDFPFRWQDYMGSYAVIRPMDSGMQEYLRQHDAFVSERDDILFYRQGEDVFCSWWTWPDHALALASACLDIEDPHAAEGRELIWFDFPVCWLTEWPEDPAGLSADPSGVLRAGFTAGPEDLLFFYALSVTPAEEGENGLTIPDRSGERRLEIRLEGREAVITLLPL